MTAAQYLANHDTRSVTVLPALPEPSRADETHHRIANSLQLLVAMVSMEARRIADPIAVAALDMTMRRITAIAGVQRMLYQSHAEATVELGAYLTDLCSELQQGCADEAIGRRVRVAAGQIQVSAEDATAVGVIVSELVSNACKYAYPAGTPGDVFVTLRAMPFDGYVLEISDRGSGIFPDAAPQGTGRGSRVIAMMAHRLGGCAVWSDAHPGTRFELYVGKC
ncbi:sensor histidine kinase [Sphingomonas soli]|uniref:sensor histidine kinase n=1 Tax=Sphingomonas soli TaxID=266127 RepID=UPI000B0BA4AA|nr:sensor histidine kinase [Sphingomonas soli]